MKFTWLNIHISEHEQLNMAFYSPGIMFT